MDKVKEKKGVKEIVCVYGRKLFVGGGGGNCTPERDGWPHSVFFSRLTSTNIFREYSRNLVALIPAILSSKQSVYPQIMVIPIPLATKPNAPLPVEEATQKDTRARRALDCPILGFMGSTQHWCCLRRIPHIDLVYNNNVNKMLPKSLE